MSDSQAKRTLPRVLISLLVTLIIGGVWFYVSLPAINLHNTSFYSFVFILLLVYGLVFMNLEKNHIAPLKQKQTLR